MDQSKAKKEKQGKRIILLLLFPASLLLLYGVLYVFYPQKIMESFNISGSILRNLLWPLLCVFVVTLLFNVFLKPAHIVKYLGKGRSIRGCIFSIIAGIISMGPIYAWYSLLRDLKQKGASSSYLAIFLGNRAIKLPLLPIMISYFGVYYVVLLTALLIIATVIIGYLIDLSIKSI